MQVMTSSHPAWYCLCFVAQTHLRRIKSLCQGLTAKRWQVGVFTQVCACPCGEEAEGLGQYSDPQPPALPSFHPPDTHMEARRWIYRPTNPCLKGTFHSPLEFSPWDSAFNFYFQTLNLRALHCPSTPAPTALPRIFG